MSDIGEPPPVTARPTGHPTMMSALPAQVVKVTAWTISGLVAAGALTLLLLLAWVFRVAVIPLVVAVLATALLDPVLRLLLRLGAGRALGAAVACAAVCAVVVTAVFIVAHTLASNAERLLQALLRAPGRFDQGTVADVVRSVAGGLRGLGGHLGRAVAEGAFHGISVASQLVTGGVLSLAITFFLLRDADRIPAVLDRVLPTAVARPLLRALRGGYLAIAGFMRGTTLIALVDAFLILVGLLILDVPGASGLAALVFVGAYVPYVGAFLSGLTAVLVALGDRGVGVALWTLGVVLVVQFVEGTFLQPTVQSRTVAMHPALVMLAVTAGFSVGSVLGALLAVPLAAASYAVVAELRRALRESPQGAAAR